MTRIAVVLVTHNSEHYLWQTLESIAGQTRQPAIRIAVDDHSADNTVASLGHAGFQVHRATSGSHDPVTRIAHNFVHGVRLARDQGADIVVLGDHDDIWHPDRIAHQSMILDERPAAALVASDGALIDESGEPLRGTIRLAFAVPHDFGSWPKQRQLLFGLRHSLATGGASAIRVGALDDWSVPAGWLHDRWWSLVALRRGRLVIDDYPVIDYRISAGQQIGMDTGEQSEPARWWMSKARRAPQTGRKIRDVVRLMRS